MTDVHVVLHPELPPGVADFLEGVAGLALHRSADERAVTESLKNGAAVLVTHTWRDSFLTPSLRWIAGTGAGYEQYPLDKFKSQGIVLTTAAGVHSQCVAEHAFALLLSLTRRIGEATRNMTQCRWEVLVGEELTGKKLAIVGHGRIGEEIARRAQNWGMSIIGIKRHPDQYSGCVEDIRGIDQLSDVCAWADIVVLSSPANADGSHMIGRKELELLGAGWIVNVGRGSLIDQAALIDALMSGDLRGAGLDVTAIEPLPVDSPLWKMPEVVITAHNAGASPGFGTRWGAIFEKNLAAFGGNGAWVNLLPAEAMDRS